MKNMNKKSIKIGFKILSVLAFGLIFMPLNKAAAALYPVYVMGGYSNDGQTYTLGHFVWSNDPDALSGNGVFDGGINGTANGNTSNGTNKNPIPRISSITPKSGDTNMTTNTITISGGGFTPTSVARINTSVRNVTFIDPSHLLMQISTNDLYAYQNNGGFFVTVYNSAPGGGYSNAVYFTIKAGAGSSSQNGGSGSLAANAFFGTNSILPSGLISWILLGMMILVIVILVRKVFGAQKRYHETPLKHA